MADDTALTIQMDETDFVDESSAPVHSSFITLAHKLVCLCLFIYIYLFRHY
jgi:hypothetical protein